MDRIPFNSAEYWQQRDRVFQRDRGKCQSPHCVDMPDFYLDGKDWELDHIVPISKSEGYESFVNSDENMRVLCLFCHATRDDSWINPTTYNSHAKLGLSYVLSDRLDLAVLKKYRWRDTQLQKFKSLENKE